MAGMTTRSYSVRATLEQAEHWEAAAVAQGRMTVGSWLAQTADAYLRELAKAGRPLPLAWFRSTFYVNVHIPETPEPRDIQVRGVESACFGIFRGDNRGPGCGGCFRHTLVHVPTRRILATLAYQRACKEMAAELTMLQINWRERDPEKVLHGAPDQGKAQEIIRRFEAGFYSK